LPLTLLTLKTTVCKQHKDREKMVADQSLLQHMVKYRVHSISMEVQKQ